MKKYVVTGGAGFIGSHLVDQLIEQNAEVVVVDNLSGGRRDRVHQKAKLEIADICKADLSSLCAGADTVFHLAALPRVQYSIEHPEETSRVNIGGTLSVLSAAHAAGVRRVVYSASSSAYGNQETLPLSESLTPQPISPYALQKYVGELYAKLYADIHNLETVSLRYFNVYGPRLDPEGPYALVIGRFLKQKREGVSLTITGDGEQTRDFTHVRDVVRANLLAADSKKVWKGEVINIGAGREVSINTLASLIGGPTEYIASRIEPRHTLADNCRARELLGWIPSVSLEEGISELLQSAL